MIEKLFEQLDDWRHLPSYKLEPRVDALLALYLRDVVAAHVGAELSEIVIPEFPLRKGTLDPKEEDNPNGSIKVDFALFGASGDIVYLVEVKTDQGSRRRKQDKDLRRARQVGWRALVEGVLQLSVHTKRYLRKYTHLLKLLEELEAVKAPPGFWDLATAKQRRDIKTHLSQVEITVNRNTPIEVLYLQPLAEGGEGCIGFEAFARIIEGRYDGIAPLLARYLRRWRKPAGFRVPGSAQ